MKKYIWDKRSDVYIIDLAQTLDLIEQAYETIRETVANGGTILYVGTKKQASPIIKQYAESVQMPYIDGRWIGGILTNHKTIASRISHLKKLEEMDLDDPKVTGFTKKELLLLNREKEKLAKSLGGIKDMERAPSLLWVVDINQEHLAISEARKLNIPIVGTLDTNCDPDNVDYPVPANDDALDSIELLTKVITEAVKEGQRERLDRLTKLGSEVKKQSAVDDISTADTQDDVELDISEDDSQVNADQISDDTDSTEKEGK